MILNYEGYEFEVVNPNTQKARRMFYAYSNSRGTDIFDAYKTPSVEKINNLLTEAW